MPDDLAAHRDDVRAGRFDRPTSVLLGDHAQANVVILPAGWAEDFAAFAAANPRPCPVIDRSAPGDPTLPARRARCGHPNRRPQIPGVRRW